jgi:glycosyltransferase involved in cell wall biosynthesis
MRVLLVNSYHYYRGGDCTYTFALADLLRGHGHQVAFFAMHHPSNLPDPDSDLFVSYIDFRDALQKRGPRDGLMVLYRAIYSSEARRKFGQMVDRFAPDIVHLQNIQGHITPSVVLEARKRELPVVWTLHDYKLLCPNSHFLVDKSVQICEACAGGAFYQAVLKRCKKGSLLASGVAMLEAYAHRMMRVTRQVGAFATPSQFLRQKLIDGGFSPGRVHHLPLFLPEDAYCGNGDDEGYLLFFGRLGPIKGIGPLLEASRQTPDVSLVLAGRVEESLAGTLPSMLPPNATYVGMKHGDELQRLLCGATAVVVPSVWYENQPFSILEAFAAAKPVIASDLGGMSELVKHGERGLLIPPGDPGALAEAMRWMASHREDAHTMGEQALEYVSRNHSADAHYEKLTALYERVRNDPHANVG